MPLEEMKILLVEDYAYRKDLLRDLLQNIGYTLALATNIGSDTFDKAREERPDLILIHTFIPRTSCLEEIRRLKADPRTDLFPILLVAGTAMPGERQKCLESGCDGYLAEPFSHDELKEEIEKLLTLAN